MTAFSTELRMRSVFRASHWETSWKCVSARLCLASRASVLCRVNECVGGVIDGIHRRESKARARWSNCTAHGLPLPTKPCDSLVSFFRLRGTELTYEG